MRSTIARGWLLTALVVGSLIGNNLTLTADPLVYLFVK